MNDYEIHRFLDNGNTFDLLKLKLKDNWKRLRKLVESVFSNDEESFVLFEVCINFENVFWEKL